MSDCWPDLRYSSIKKTSEGQRQKRILEGEREKKKHAEKEEVEDENEDRKTGEEEGGGGGGGGRKRRACGVRSSYGTCY